MGDSTKVFVVGWTRSQPAWVCQRAFRAWLWGAWFCQRISIRWLLVVISTKASKVWVCQEGLQSLTLGPESIEGRRVRQQPFKARLLVVTLSRTWRMWLGQKASTAWVLAVALIESLNCVVLACKLESLTFGDDFDQSLEAVTFPESLQNQKFGRDFNQGLERF